MNFLKNFKVMNNVLGWIVFIFASAVYLLTKEPTVSWWDCGEYISTAYKLEVGHPPGAPFFQLIGRFFTLFAGDDVSKVAMMVNSMSAILSGFAILFLFWTITALAKKLYVKSNSYDLTVPQIYIILGAGLVGALTCTFSDSFWFSAVEGEVYATSAFFTAIVFWAILKWEVVADEKYANRWIVFIAFMIGLSIGVHLLNLLCIPAMTFIYYFRKVKQSRKNFIVTLILSVIILGFIQSGIIPWTVKMAGYFELFFVNTAGMPFNSGTIIYFVIIVGLIVLGLIITKKRAHTIMNTIILSFAFILIGYSSFLVLVIRANANTPINENAPEDALTLLTYLNRDQYGDWPVLYGQYFNTKVVDTKEGNYNYIKGEDKYIRTNRKLSYKYDPAGCGLFPRMWSDQDKHIRAYMAWTGTKGKSKPTFGENLAFLFKNQLGNQYWRYFLWNFAGRQNDIQGFGIDEAGNKDIANGNWLSGINFLDAARLGSQDKLTDKMQTNKGRNTYYFLPLLLGLAGLIYHFRKNKKDAFVVLLLFIMTGVAIILYLNPTPYQPRERDYAYAGSFYSFAIWVGLGVIAIYHFISKFKIPKLIAVFASVLTGLLLVPVIMANQNWDDHDRSDKYACRDYAKNYLASCAPNAILITNGDNDTFPLWYAQEVEGFRTDVRVVNFTLASGDWYIHQLFNKIYDSDPLPFTIPSDKYTAGTNDFVPYYEKDPNNYWDLKKIINFINSDKQDNKVRLQDKRYVAYLPTKLFSLKVDSLKVCNNGTVPSYLTDKVVKAITWKMRKNTLYKNDLMLLDIIATNNWERPIYFASPSSVKDFIDIDDYCFLEGCVYRFLPVKGDAKRGGVLTNETYDCFTKKFAYGNLNDPNVYVDKESYGMSLYLRNNFARLAQALISEGKKKEALEILNKGVELMPDYAVPFDLYMIGYAELYFMCGENAKANEIFSTVGTIYDQDLEYYESVDQKTFAKNVSYFASNRDLTLGFHGQDTQQALQILQALMAYSDKYGQKEESKKYATLLSKYVQMEPERQ